MSSSHVTLIANRMHVDWILMSFTQCFMMRVQPPLVEKKKQVIFAYIIIIQWFEKQNFIVDQSLVCFFFKTEVA